MTIQYSRVVVAGVLFVLMAARQAPAQMIQIDEFPASPPPIGPNDAGGGITVGPDKNIWFANYSRQSIGRITPDVGNIAATVVEFPTSKRPLDVVGVPGTSGGVVWFTELEDKIGEIVPAAPNAISESPLLTPFWPASWLCTTPNGDVWATDTYNGIYQITPAPTFGTPPTVTSYTVPSIPVGGLLLLPAPTKITLGPDGNLWFTEEAADRIGRALLTNPNQINTFPIPPAPGLPAANPDGITTGPDGNLWFTEQQRDMIGRITPSGSNAIKEFGGLTPGSEPFDMAAGSDGGLWFTEVNASYIGRIDPNPPNAVTEYPIPSGGKALDIVGGPDGNLWFTEQSGDRVGRVRLKFLVEHGRRQRIFVPNNYVYPHFASILGDLVYVPAKTTFAVLGMVASGVTYLATIGNGAAAEAVWNASTRGDYAITPDMIRRNITPRFVGSSFVATSQTVDARFLPLVSRGPLVVAAPVAIRAPKKGAKRGR